MTFAQRDVSSLLLHVDWSRSIDIMETMPSYQKFHNVTLLMCIICNILCCAIAISNFDSKTCNTPQRDYGKIERGRSARIYDNVLSRFRVDAQNSA